MVMPAGETQPGAYASYLACCRKIGSGKARAKQNFVTTLLLAHFSVYVLFSESHRLVQSQLHPLTC